jgi:DNA-binding transcriptional LysR family regulator
VVSGEADFGLTFLATHEPDIDFHLIIEDNFVLACRRDHPLARKEKVSWTELNQYDFMAVSKRSGNRLIMDMALANIPQRPRSIYEAQHLTTLLGLVEAGLGVAAVPALSMSDSHHPMLMGIPLVEPVVTRKLGLIRRNGRSLSPAAQPLYTLLQDLGMSG